VEKALDGAGVILVAELRADEALGSFPAVEAEREHPAHLVFDVGVRPDIGAARSDGVDQLVDERRPDVNKLSTDVRVPCWFARVAHQGHERGGESAVECSQRERRHG
jgi:hypothetical protein